MITLSKEERDRLKARREELGYTHKQVGARIGVTGPTISNIETGRSGQVRKSIYAKVLRLYFRSEHSETSSASDDAYKAMVAEIVELDDDQIAIVRALTRSLKLRKD